MNDAQSKANAFSKRLQTIFLDMQSRRGVVSAPVFYTAAGGISGYFFLKEKKPKNFNLKTKTIVILGFLPYKAVSRRRWPTGDAVALQI